MKRLTVLGATLALVLMGAVTVAAQDGKGEKKPLDRGDKKAEKALKKAYERVSSAEADGLERMKAGANINIDTASAGIPFQVPPVDGTLLWRKGDTPLVHTEEAEGGSGGGMPGMDMTGMAKEAFAPFLSFVLGFEAWDAKFAEASFQFGAPVESEEGPSGTTVIVTYADEEKPEETWLISENKVVSMTAEREFQGQKQQVTYAFEYEDKGSNLKLNKVTFSSKVDVPEGGMPGNDPKRPVPKGEGADDEENTMETTVELTEFATLGKAEVCTKLEVTIKLKIFGNEMEIPASLELKDPKGNKDVTDEDLKPLDDAKEDGGEGSEESDDEF